MVDSDFIAAHADHIGKTMESLLRIYDTGKATDDYNEAEVIAISTLLMNLYTGFETIIRHITEGTGHKLIKSGSWHKDLLNVATESGIISRDMRDMLIKYMAFRHLHVHGYGYMHKLDEFKHLAGNAKDTADKFFIELKEKGFL